MKNCCITVMCILACVQSAFCGSWDRVAQLQGAGGAKEVPVNKGISSIRIRCSEGSVTINTVVIREGGRKSPMAVARNLAVGQEHVLNLGSVRMVTGLRISDGGGGTYEVFVERSGQGSGVSGANPSSGGKWHAITELRSGGGVKEVPVNRTASRCLIRCIDGAVVVNTLVVREGGAKKSITVASRLNTGDERVLDLGGRRNVTGFRISDGGRGRYAIYVGD